MGGLGGTEILIIIAVILIFFFGANKIPELARGIGQGMKEFKNATNEELDDGDKNENTDQTDSAEAKKNH